MSENKLNNLEYAPWLEQSLRELLDFPVEGICMFAVTNNGAVYSNYHNITMGDKLLISGFIQQDAMLESLGNQGLIDIPEELHEEDLGDGEEEV